MPRSLPLLVPLAPLVLQVVLGRSALRSAGTRSVSAASQSCSCDCCSVEREDQSVHSHSGSLKCAPRFASIGETSECSDICMLPDNLRAAFESEKGEADYSQYCWAQCKPVGRLHDRCVDGSLVETVSEEPSVNASRPRKKGMAQLAIGTAVESRTAAVGASETALVEMAKQKMGEAEMQAESAGKAAFQARTAFERLQLSIEEMAVEASQQTLHEIKSEAAQTSKQALDIRLNYEKNAQATATRNAQNAAAVYTKAEGRDMNLANIWNERSQQFATAAGQRETMAMDFAAEAQQFQASHQLDMAKQRMVMAQQAMDQARAFAAQSESAHKQAQAIASSKGWYEYAKKAIAANVLAKSMPHDVPPPPMPQV